MRARLKALLLQILREHRAPAPLALAVGIGIFVGTLPLYGLHLPICVGLSRLLRLNLPLLYLAANISNPLMAPVLVAASIVIGEGIRFRQLRPLDLEAGRSFLSQWSLIGGHLTDVALSCLLGSVVLGAILGLLGGGATWLWARRREPTR